MMTAAAQTHQSGPVHSMSSNTNARTGYPSNMASKSPFIRSSTQDFTVVVLKPNRSSSLNCAYQVNGKLTMLNATPVMKRKPAIANTEVPKADVNFPNAHGKTPLNRIAKSNTASNSVATSPKRLFAMVYSTER